MLSFAPGRVVRSRRFAARGTDGGAIGAVRIVRRKFPFRDIVRDAFAGPDFDPADIGGYLASFQIGRRPATR